jgi:hypothetical protein
LQDHAYDALAAVIAPHSAKLKAWEFPSQAFFMPHGPIVQAAGFSLLAGQGRKRKFSCLKFPLKYNADVSLQIGNIDEGNFGNQGFAG